jgi:spermidine synthase
MPSLPKFEELDYRETPLGDLILRRRTVLSLDNLEVHEIILGESFLMSSLFTEVEVALADLGLEALEASNDFGTEWDVVVGGLGLGYTARAALKNPKVHSLAVVETLDAVIDWHQQGLVPLGQNLTSDPRCQFVHDDFFALALDTGSSASFNPQKPGQKAHAVLLDIDHSPSKLLHEQNGEFYQAEGLRCLADKLHPGGIFALWSDDPPDDDFMSSLEEVFVSCKSHIVTFDNPIRGGESSSTVYVARRSPT